MKLKELLPLMYKDTEFKIGIINPRDSFDVTDVDDYLTVEDTKILNKYKELEIDNIETPQAWSEDTYLAIYLIGKDEE